MNTLIKIKIDIQRGKIYNPGTWAVIIFRYGTLINESVQVPMLREILLISYYLSRLPIELITGVQIGLGAKIGSGLYIFHYGGIVIGNRCVIGNNFTINHCTTIGAAGPKDNWASPIIGDNVWVSPGARLLGGIRVGSDVVIGANSVVIRDVLDKSVVAGVPARVINTNEYDWT